MAAFSRQERGSSAASLMMPRTILLLSTFALVLLGCVMIYSASTITALSAGVSPLNNLRDQLIFAGIGIVLCLLIWKVVPYVTWRYPAAVWAVWALAVILLLATAIGGTVVNGARRWLMVGGMSIQPAEFAKIAFVLMAVRTMDLYAKGHLGLRELAVYGAVGVLLPLGFLFVTQSDFGTTAICLVGVMGVLWLGGVSLRVILNIAGLVAIAAVLVIVFGAAYRSDRFLFVDPWNDGKNGLGAGYQMVHSYFAIAEGGLFGVGLGCSKEKFLYLPEAETDYIFAIIAEELGFVGAVVVIVLFMLILYAGLQIARQAPDLFGAMLAGSFSIIIVAQAFLNIGCVVGVLPTTGKPLPFVSSGGSSLIASLMMVGFIMAVADEACKPSVFERRRNDLTVIHNRARDSRFSSANAARFSPLGKKASRQGGLAYEGGAFLAQGNMPGAETFPIVRTP